MNRYIVFSVSIIALIAAFLICYLTWWSPEGRPMVKYASNEKSVSRDANSSVKTGKLKPVEQKYTSSTFNLISEYEKSQDLYHFVQEMERLGREGNPNAYAMAALAINSCAMLGVTPGYANQLYNSKHVIDRARFDSAITRLNQRCSRLISMNGVSNSIVQNLLEKSARQGSPIAAAKLIAEDPTLSVSRLEPLVKRIIASANPIAYRQLAITVGINSQLKGKDVGDSADSYGLEILSCKLGNDCGPQSIAMLQVCINTRFCKPIDYVSFLKQQLSPAVFSKASSLANRLMNQINAGQRPSIDIMSISSEDGRGEQS